MSSLCSILNQARKRHLLLSSGCLPVAMNMEAQLSPLTGLYFRESAEIPQPHRATWIVHISCLPLPHHVSLDSRLKRMRRCSVGDMREISEEEKTIIFGDAESGTLWVLNVLFHRSGYSECTSRDRNSPARRCVDVRAPENPQVEHSTYGALHIYHAQSKPKTQLSWITHLK